MDNLKNKSITFRLTNEEYTNIQNMAESMGKEVSEYVREQALLQASDEHVKAFNVLLKTVKKMGNLRTKESVQEFRKASINYLKLIGMLDRHMK